MFDLAWITLYEDEQREVEAIDREIDCAATEAQRAWEHGLTGLFEQMVAVIDDLRAERDSAGFALEIIY